MVDHNFPNEHYHFINCFSHGNFHVDSISLLPLSHPWIGPSPASRIAPAQSIPWTPVRLRTAVYHNKNPVGHELQHFCFIKVSCQIFFTHSQEVRASPLFHHLHHLHHLPMKSHYVHLKKKGPKQRCRPGTVNFPRPKKLVKVSMTCEFYRKEKKSKFHWLRRKPTSSSESQPFVGSSWKQHHPAVYPLVN